MRLPGYPAFVMSTQKQKKEAFVRFFFVVLFSLLPLILIAFLNSISQDQMRFFDAVARYTQAGQIYFYVGAITGGAFLLVRDNFRGSVRERGAKLTGGEELMQTERTWLTLYMIFVGIASAVILSVYHLGVEKNHKLIYWSSAAIYAVSLYVWFVDILYSQIDFPDGPGQDEEEDAGPLVDPSVSRISAALGAMGTEIEK